MESENKDGVNCKGHCMPYSACRAVTFVDNLEEATDLEEIDEIRNVMMMRDVWQKIAKSGRMGVRLK